MRLCRARKGLPYPLGVLLSKSLIAATGTQQEQA